MSNERDLALPPRLSVIVPCHDSSAVIGGQLEALSRQVDAPAFEVICVDNRSSDDLAAAVSPWTSRLRVQVVTADLLANPGYARNVGVAHARADKLAFCDSDDHVAPTWVRDAARALDAAAIVNGGATPVADADFSHGPDHLDDLLDEQALATRPVDVALPAAPVPYPILLGGSCAVRRAVYLELGGYDVAMPYGVEDNDLALRAQQAGHEIARSSGMRLAYRSRPEGTRTAADEFRTGLRHQLLAARHHLVGRSPSLPRRWWWGLPRCLGAAVRMLVRPGSRDWRGWRHRTAFQWGLLVGRARFGWFGRPPRPRLGVGLSTQAEGNDRPAPAPAQGPVPD
ncbi:glycosyltransferase family 2 protein [Aestuariimicrobium soli]|uniref:glycosyltransferase family 2 protein n=1 Tax=Aestuariimicrobium soli TaxID=2035834 RepID=UPI003EB7C568